MITTWWSTFKGFFFFLLQSLSTAFVGEALLHSSFEKDLGSVAAGESWSQSAIFALREITNGIVSKGPSQGSLCCFLAIHLTVKVLLYTQV